VVAGYEGNNVQKPIVELAKGSGGLAEFTSQLQDDKILYGLCRTTDVYEGVYSVQFMNNCHVGPAI
jgi:hypothetical protein